MAAFLFLCLILAVPLSVFFYWDWKTYIQISCRFPGPRTIPFIGNAHNIGSSSSVILSNIFKWWAEFGQKNFRIVIGHDAHILISEVKDVEFILTSTTITKKARSYAMLHPWLGQGLLTAFGSHWVKHRKMITPSFHFTILQDFHDVMNQNSTKFLKKLQLESAGENIFDLQPLVGTLTLDIICETAMGISIKAMDNPKSELAAAFRDMCENINMRAYHPIKRSNFLYKFTADYPAYMKTLKTLLDFTNEVIDKRRIYLDNSTKEVEQAEENYTRRKKAFLDNLLTATIDGKPLTRQEIYEEVSTFIFEGFDTTTSGIVFTAYMLSRNPKIQEKLFAEQVEIMADELDRSATYQEIADMRYLDQVIKESQRLYPSVPIIGRTVEKDYNMNGTLLPKGTTIGVFIMGLGYRKETFKDPYRCNPERFDPSNLNEKISPFSFVPFSAGPRNCIGQKFAMLELKTVLSKIIRTYEILPPEDDLICKDGYVEHTLGMSAEEKAKHSHKQSKYIPILSAVLTLKSDNGVHIRLRRRQR